VDPRLGRAWPALASLVALASSFAAAQQTPDNTAGTTTAPSPPTAGAASELQMVPPAANETTPALEAPKAPRAPKIATPPAPPPPPPGPPPPVRSPTAILRVLDKVTAETLRFEAPVGKRVRYKTLMFMVKACETRGLSDPQSRPSAYVVIDSEPPALPGQTAPAAKEIYRGWMFAVSPGLHPFEHPVYDAWLESCTSDSPPH
jgi:hypothetical protein